MRPSQRQIFIKLCTQLSSRQRLAGIDLLRNGAAQDAATALIEQAA